MESFLLTLGVFAVVLIVAGIIGLAQVLPRVNARLRGNWRL